MPRISRPVGYVLIALLLAAVLCLSLPGRTLWQRVLQDAGHGPVFAGVALVLLGMRRAAGASTFERRDYTRAFFLSVLLGAGTELAQWFLPGRSVSLLDVGHDAAGAAFGLALAAGLDRRAGGAPRGAVVLAVLLGTIVVLGWEPLQCARAYAERSAAFPTLAPMGAIADRRFATGRDAELTRGDLPAPWRRDEDRGPAWRLGFASGSRPALEWTEASPDWRGRSVLALDVTNPGPAALRFVLRVLDARHDWSHEDRLNLPVVVPPRTRTTVRVAVAAIESAPRGRTMDLSSIANVMLFAPEPLPGDAFYVSRVWLE